MMDINLGNFIIVNEREFLDFLSKEFPLLIRDLEKEGLKELALFIKRETRDYIKSGALGNASRVARSFESNEENTEKSFEKSNSFRSSKADLSFLMRYFRWVISDSFNSTDLNIDFRRSNRKEIDFLITQVQVGTTIKVTEKMRRAFGLTSTPLQSSTLEIRIPPREIDGPVFDRVKNKVFRVLNSFFFNNFNRIQFRE